MDAQKADMFIMAKGDYFESHQLSNIKDRILEMDEEEWMRLQTANFKNPTISLIMSLVVGSFAIDRFFIGDTGLGVVKLLTCGGLGVWVIVDWFLIMGATREKNMEKLQRILP